MKNKEKLEELRTDWINNQQHKVSRCMCCEWKYFIVDGGHKYLSYMFAVCDDCQEELNKRGVV